MFRVFMAGINQKRFVISVLVMFGYIWVSDFLIHWHLLGDVYRLTHYLWRPESEMRDYMGWMLLGQFVIAKFVTLIFAKGYENKGIGEGIRFGIIIGVLFAGTYFVQYAVYPLTHTILWSWVGFGLAQTILGGVVLSLVYRR